MSKRRNPGSPRASRPATYTTEQRSSVDDRRAGYSVAILLIAAAAPAVAGWPSVNRSFNQNHSRHDAYETHLV